MKNKKQKINISTLAVALLSTLFVQVASAEGIEKSVEIGGNIVSKDSAKFGEYNGLNESGVDGSFKLRGGDAFDGTGGTKLWGFSGSDLGTTSRSLNASMSDQGSWKFNMGFDELRHNISDTYQTPLIGSMGGNTFKLPGTFDGVTDPNVLSASQLSAFHTEKVSTTRNNTSVGAGYIFNSELNFKFDYNHLDQSGAKLLAAASDTGIEAVNIIMNPTKYKTDSFNASLNWVGEKAHLTGAYFNSTFRDGFNSVDWENAIGATPPPYQAGRMSTAPNSDFHRFSLLGGYKFTSDTKLVGGLSYGRNTQKDLYLNNLMSAGMPQTSLNGLVITEHADLKLTNQTTKDLSLSAAMKYNERHNRSSSNTYVYDNIDGGPYTAINTPYSNKKTQAELALDYRLFDGQNVRLAYERENIKRWCDDRAFGAQCVSSPASKEDKLGATYRLNAFEDFNFNAGYTYAKRRGEFDHTFLSNIGFDPNAGLNAQDKPGFEAAPFLTRKEHLVNTGANWQATEKLNLAVSDSYTKDNYEVVLGIQNAHSNNINLDATYIFNENTSLSAYTTWQTGERTLMNALDSTTTPPQIWTNLLKDDSNSIGLTGSHRGLMAGKMEIIANASYSLDKSTYSTQVPYDTTCSDPANLTCGSLPDIESKLITLKLMDNYQIDKNSKVAVGYTYQHRTSVDYFYNAYQFGNTPTTSPSNLVMPTNEQAPTYNVSLVTVSYNYNF